MAKKTILRLFAWMTNSHVKKIYIEDDKLILERINKEDPKRLIIDPAKEEVKILGRVVKVIKDI